MTAHPVLTFYKLKLASSYVLFLLEFQWHKARQDGESSRDCFNFRQLFLFALSYERNVQALAIKVSIIQGSTLRLANSPQLVEI